MDSGVRKRSLNENVEVEIALLASAGRPDLSRGDWDPVAHTTRGPRPPPVHFTAFSGRNFLKKMTTASVEGKVGLEAVLNLTTFSTGFLAQSNIDIHNPPRW